MDTSASGRDTTSDVEPPSTTGVINQSAAPPNSSRTSDEKLERERAYAYAYVAAVRRAALAPADRPKHQTSDSLRSSRTPDGARNNTLRVPPPPPPSFHPRFFPTHLPPPPPAAAHSDAALVHRLNCEYAAFVAHEKHTQWLYTHSPAPLPPNVVEVVGDIFSDAPAGMALAHSVAEDFEMSAGIAVQFKRRFGQVDRLRTMGRTVGQVAVLPVAQQDGTVRYIFYVITKKKSRGTRPVLSDFAAAVHNLADVCTTLGVKQLALPRIGTMKDRLQWCDVRRIIGQAFETRETVVYVYRPDRKKPPSPPTLLDFIDPLLPKTPSSSQSEPDTFFTPATPRGTPAPKKRSCPLPDEGVPSAADSGPCATKVSEKKEDAGRASSLDDSDIEKTLTTAQGPDRSVQISPISATSRFLNDLQKSTSAKKRRSSIPRPITPTILPIKNIENVDNCSFPDFVVHSDSQSREQTPNEDEAGGRPAASLQQRSSANPPAAPRAGDAKSQSQAVKQNPQRAPIKYGGRSSFRQNLYSASGKNSLQKNTLNQVLPIQR
jgi:O-acetyl-ADP-ribose deacetylase (regulator of RNase III)